MSTVKFAGWDGAIVSAEARCTYASSLQFVASAVTTAFGPANAATVGASDTKVGIFTHTGATNALAVAGTEVVGVDTVANRARFLHAS